MQLPADTLDRVLIAAEKLFAEHGYHGTTLRQITQAAKANLAAVNYHHGDKESLYLEILRRRLRTINQERLRLLTEAEQGSGENPVPLETLFEIMAGPLFALGAPDKNPGRSAAQLLGRSLIDPLPFAEPFLTAEFQPVMARFAQALRRHVPALTPEDFLWRFTFVVGAMQHTLASLHRMGALTRGICRDHDPVAAMTRFVPFAVQAFRPSQQSG